MATTRPVSEEIDLYADGAVVEKMVQQYKANVVRGFTTNPTLMAKAGIRDYEAFAREVIRNIPDRSVSLEVFSDDFKEMEAQARKIASWGDNVYVKIPITNTRRDTSLPLIRQLLDHDIKLNVTAMTTSDQVRALVDKLEARDHVIISIFAGRIADTGVDPMPIMRHAVGAASHLPNAKVLWASPREVLNAYQAIDCGCHIITMTDDLLAKLKLQNKSLPDYSLDTVKMFYDDAKAAGYKI